METGTLIRTIVLVLALINQALVMAGYSPLPFDDAESEQFITLLFTIGASIWSWWKNNNITHEAKVASKKMKAQKRFNKHVKTTGSPVVPQSNNEQTGGTL